jgi:hypothetical protein
LGFGWWVCGGLGVVAGGSGGRVGSFGGVEGRGEFEGCEVFGGRDDGEVFGGEDVAFEGDGGGAEDYEGGAGDGALVGS